MANKRYYILDYIRLFVIINMILYHLLWDMVYIFDVDFEWFRNSHLWQRFICISFILLSGFCWSLSRRHIKRGVIILICGAVISIITTIFMPLQAVRFGILTFLGFSILLMIPLERALKCMNDVMGLITSLILFLLSYNINTGYLCFGTVELPEELYNGNLMTFIGFRDKSFYSTDYFSLFPWIFMFMAGYFLYRYMYRKNIMGMLEKGKNNIISIISSWGIVIYMIHQPIIYGILTLLF